MARRNGNKGEGTPQGQAPPAQEQQTQGNGGHKPPAAEFRLGRVKVTIWENNSEQNGKWYSIVPARTFKKDDGTWGSAHSFGRDDCLTLAECMRQALLWVNQQYGGGWRKQDGDAAETPNTPAGDDIPF